LFSWQIPFGESEISDSKPRLGGVAATASEHQLKLHLSHQDVVRSKSDEPATRQFDPSLTFSGPHYLSIAAKDKESRFRSKEYRDDHPMMLATIILKW
jgi:hypothetical protein